MNVKVLTERLSDVMNPQAEIRLCDINDNIFYVEDIIESQDINTVDIYFTTDEC